MATAGQYVTDGTAIFIIRDTRDGAPVGRPITDDILRDSYVKRNGALLQRSSYPTLVKFLQDNPSLVTTEANWPSAKNLWTWGDGTSTTGTTIRVPNDCELYEKLSDSLGLVAAGLPNVLGFYSGNIGEYGGFSGALYIQNQRAHNAWSGSYTVSRLNDIVVDASRSSSIYGNSNTVTPPSVRRIAQMKY